MDVHEICMCMKNELGFFDPKNHRNIRKGELKVKVTIMLCSEFIYTRRVNQCMKIGAHSCEERAQLLVGRECRYEQRSSTLDLW